MTGAPKRLQGQAVGWAAVALLVVPTVVDWVATGPSRLFGYVATDTFYYLVVGRNIGLHGVVAFDGTNLSNGFHPAWQALVAVPYALRLISSPSLADVIVVLVLSLGCVAGALSLLSRALAREDGSLHPAFVMLPFGAYALLVAPAWLTLSLEQLKAQNVFEGSEPLYGTLWSSVNGMETPLVLLAFAALFWVWVRGVEARPTLFGGLLGLLGLARLDHLLIAGPLFLLAGWKLRGHTRSLLRLSVAFALPVATYMLANRVVFGGVVPISGSMKSSAPLLTPETFDTAIGVMNAAFTPDRPPIYIYWRVLQLLIPTLVALLSPLALLRARRADGPTGSRSPSPTLEQGPFSLPLRPAWWP